MPNRTYWDRLGIIANQTSIERKNVAVYFLDRGRASRKNDLLKTYVKKIESDQPTMLYSSYV